VNAYLRIARPLAIAALFLSSIVSSGSAASARTAPVTSRTAADPTNVSESSTKPKEKQQASQGRAQVAIGTSRSQKQQTSKNQAELDHEALVQRYFELRHLETSW